MEYIDLKGMSCPFPVIETKKLVESRKVLELNVLVDNGPPKENVTRYLESQGYCVSVEKEQADTAVLHATKTEGAEAISVQTGKKVVVLVDGATVGRGDDLLGAVLMKSFLHTLKEIEPRPWRLIFINAGVKLAAEGSDLLSVLSELERLGIEILSCGTCLDFFELKEKLRAGKVTNMYDIVSSLVTATNVIRP
ncbi:MAG TPA: sulfurtransferase-like selenium metabolism protein YedF [Syntrophorhabdales bacterium]|nr:sulfurtransferase-like selenium metabolism protein YedF [Syntrophorhabdales bacterium]